MASLPLNTVVLYNIYIEILPPVRACSYGQKLSRLARKLFDKFTSEISPWYTILGDPSHIFYQRTMEHNKHNYNLRHRDGIFKYAPFSGTERHRNSFIPRAMRQGLH